jgi:hypothetical protein
MAAQKQQSISQFGSGSGIALTSLTPLLGRVQAFAKTDDKINAKE